MLGPQQTAAMPRSSLRIAGMLLMNTVGEPRIAGPVDGCGQAGQPCASASALARSPTVVAPGIVWSSVDIDRRALDGHQATGVVVARAAGFDLGGGARLYLPVLCLEGRVITRLHREGLA